MKRRSRVEEESWGKGGGKQEEEKGRIWQENGKRTWERKKNREIRDKERRRTIKGDLSLAVSRMENWLLDGTWSLGQVCLYDFRKKLKWENDHKVQEGDKKLSGGEKRDTWSSYDFPLLKSRLPRDKWNMTVSFLLFHKQFHNCASPEDDIIHFGSFTSSNSALLHLIFYSILCNLQISVCIYYILVLLFCGNFLSSTS